MEEQAKEGGVAVVEEEDKEEQRGPSASGVAPLQEPEWVEVGPMGAKLFAGQSA